MNYKYRLLRLLVVLRTTALPACAAACRYVWGKLAAIDYVGIFKAFLHVLAVTCRAVWRWMKATAKEIVACAKGIIAASNPREE